MSNIWNWAYYALKAAKADNLFEEKGSPILLKEDKEYGEYIYAPNTEYTRLVRVLDAKGKAEGLVAPEKQENYSPITLQGALIQRLQECAFDASPWEEAQTTVPRWMRATKRLQEEAFDKDAVIARNNEAILRDRQGTQGGSGRANQWAPAPTPATKERQAQRRGEKIFNRAWDRARLSGVGADLVAVLNRANSTINNLSITPEEKTLSEAAIARLARRAKRKADLKAKREREAAIKAAETPKTKVKTKVETKVNTEVRRMSGDRRAELKAQFRNRAVKGREGFFALASAINNLGITAENLSAIAKTMLSFAAERLGCTIEETIDEIRLLSTTALRALERDWANTRIATTVDTETVNANYNAILARYGQSARSAK